MVKTESFKEIVDRRDKTYLKYIFANALNIDPTFDQYRDNWEYMKKNFPEVFDKHKECTCPLTSDKSKWNDKYWVGLGYDLLYRNFSEKRFNHMREVAKIVLADKIVRLRKERKEREESKNQKSSDENIKIRTAPTVRKARTRIIEAIVSLSNGEIDHKQFTDIRKKCEDGAKAELYVDNDGKSLEYDSSISYTRDYLNNAIDRCLYSFSKKDVEIAASIALNIHNNEHTKETPVPEKINPTKFQKIKAKVVSLFVSLVNGITNMVNKMKDGRFKGFLLGLLRRAKAGLAKSKSLNAARPEVAKQLSDDAKNIQEKLNQMKTSESFTCDSFINFCSSTLDI